MNMGPKNLINKFRLHSLVKELLKDFSKIKSADFREQLVKTIWSIKELRVMLKGWKTYIMAALGAVVTGLYMAGKITREMYEMLMGLLGSGAIATVAAKINRLSKDK